MPLAIKARGVFRRSLGKLLFRVPPARRYLAEKSDISQRFAILKREYDMIVRERNWLSGSKREPRLDASSQLIKAVNSGDDLSCVSVHQFAEDVETLLQSPDSDRIGVHREIGKALFARSTDLYSGKGLPHYLVRYTYPPVISIALNSHCNAACFFCRDADYKGTSIEFSEIRKLESAIRNARVIDLTGWGEPFLYPRLQEIVEYILSVNSDTPHLVQFTTNGTLLSKRWGEMLSGKLHRLVISMNAATPDTYAVQMLYKNKHFTLERTIENIREFMGELTPLDRGRILLHMVANTGNFREISSLMVLAKELGVSTVNVGNYICADAEHMSKTLWHVKEEYNAEVARARKLSTEIGVGIHARTFFSDEKKLMGAESCTAPFEQFFIEMQGTTAPCCFMGKERMGNVYEEGFEAVWFSDLMNKLRAERFLPPCKVCTIFTPFDSKPAHVSAFLLTKDEEVVTTGGPQYGGRANREKGSLIHLD
jgi:MoaA/NifB/PqqE/SkfB family radical SAM enzyme